ncbi:hypothetical protein [Neptunomonas antarctica]|uniref:Uncharacterized protein n=1 Tax=Neptunomonas antarctica TaxID=619304 RepID=A0A1N7PJD4_9GAMM|nr:hypothetical protein [Neptunomonas antarctica]SIT10489.1 hypothetical protein SAMN05421760_11546 [Neptunomonas antarctica]
MFGVDKYNLISFVPSVAVIGVSIVLVFVGIGVLKKMMAQDAAKAAARDAE